MFKHDETEIILGIMVTTVALQAYMLDCYPEGSGEGTDLSALLTIVKTHESQSPVGSILAEQQAAL